MKKTFELDYPDGAMIIADLVQKTLCRHWAMPVRVREVTGATEQPEPAPDEGEPLSVDELAILQSIACGCMLEHNIVTDCCKHMSGEKVPYSKFMLLRTAGLIELLGPRHDIGQPHINGYLISPAGRALLASREG